MIKEKNIIKYLFIFVIISIFGLNNVMASESYEDLGNLNDKTTFYIIDNSPIQAPQEMPRGQEWNFEDYDIYSFIINIDNTTFKKSYTYQLTLTLPRSIITGANAYTVVDSNGDSCATGLIKDMDTNYPKFTFSCGIDTNSIGLQIYNNNGNPIINNRWWFTWSNIQLQRLINSDEELNNTIKNQLSTCRDSYNLLKLIPTTQGIATVTDTNVILNGTVNEAFSIKVGEIILKSHTTYTFESFQEGNKLNSYFLINQYGDTVYLSENNLQFIVTNNNTYEFYLIVTDGTYSSVNFKPMISLGDKPKNRYEKFGEEICINKIDETNDILGDLNDSLNNSNVNGSLSGAGSFFDNFNNTDHGGLTGILTAPLVSINQMLNTSCSPMTATFKGKQLSLPCGYDFWSRMGGIQDFLNIVLGGLICYRIIIKLYKSIEKIKNPEDDRIEVIDL